MTTPQKPITTRTVLTGAAMLGAAAVAFSLNQGGLTGRATGGAVGCGGPEPTASTSEKDVSPVKFEPGGDSPLELKPAEPRIALRLAPDGRSIQQISQTNLIDLEDVAVVDPARAVGPTIVTVERSPTLWDRFERDGMQSFMEYAELAGLRPVFEDVGAKLTVFVPTDAAFEEMPSELLLDENRALLQAVLLHHITPERRKLSELPGDFVATNLPLQPLRFIDGDTVEGSLYGQATVIKPNRETDQGMVHVVDGVLMPHFTLPTMLLKHEFKLFHAMLVHSGHLEAVSDPNTPMTIIAVSDENIRAFGIELDEIETGLGGMVRSIVENHVIYGAHDPLNSEMKTLSNLWVSRDDNFLKYSNGARLKLGPKTKASNGPIWTSSMVVDSSTANN